jgi:hypothetical protein
MESLVEEAAAKRESRSPADFDVFAREHAETVRQGASNGTTRDG